jgi:transposase-like protein
MLAKGCVTKNCDLPHAAEDGMERRGASENPRYRCACCGFEYLRSSTGRHYHRSGPVLQRGGCQRT